MDNTDLEPATETEKGTPEKVKPERAHRLVPFQHSVDQVSLIEEEKRVQNAEVNEHDEGVIFEPVVQQPYILSYVCLMIPRFDNHYLAGDLVDWLFEWMQNIAVSCSWKLEWLDIEKSYMQWLLSVPVAIPPSHFFRVIRHYTSQQIFTEFPRFRNENIGRDFWAPGHLVIVGRRPHAPEMISEFIRLTRLQQGISSYQRR